MNSIANTFSLHLHELQERLTFLDIFNIVRINLQLAPNQVRCIRVVSDYVFHVTVTNEELLTKVFAEFGEFILVDRNGRMCRVFIKRINAFTTVRVEGLPFSIPNEVLEKCLEKYGSVLDIKNEVWEQILPFQIHTGTRIVSMTLAKSIPFCLEINACHVRVSYEGQQISCNRCNDSNYRPQIQRNNLPPFQNNIFQSQFQPNGFNQQSNHNIPGPPNSGMFPGPPNQFWQPQMNQVYHQPNFSQAIQQSMYQNYSQQMYALHMQNLWKAAQQNVMNTLGQPLICPQRPSRNGENNLHIIPNRKAGTIGEEVGKTGEKQTDEKSNKIDGKEKDKENMEETEKEASLWRLFEMSE